MHAMLITAMLVLTGSASASPVGEWTVQDRSARVAIRKCGPNVCGKISWSSDGKDLGRPILIDMKPEGARWSGEVVDVRDGTKYLAHIALQSERELKLDGCVMGGAICSGEVWSRFR